MNRRPSHVGVGHQLAEQLRRLGACSHVLHLDHLARQVVGELELDSRANRSLLDDVGGPAVFHDIGVHIEISSDEHALPGHLDLIEDQERVLLVEPRRERMIRSSAIYGVVIAADRVQSLCPDGYREAQCIDGIRVLWQWVCGVHEVLVCEGTERAQDLRTADNDPVLGAPDDAWWKLGIDAVDIANGFVDHRVDDRVRQGKITERDVALKCGERRTGAGVAVLFEQAALSDEARDGDVDVVGRAPEHAYRVAGQAVECAVAPPEIVVARRDDVAGVDQFASGGVFDETLVGVVVLVVEVLGDSAQGSGELWFIEDVDSPAVEPDRAAVLQTADVLLASACTHPCTVPADR